MPWLNQITSCSDLASCFQAIYNLGIVVLFSLAFLNMVYGAIEYLFSAGSITSKESGKNRIMNSIGAIIVVLVLPQILHIINPRIFEVKLKIPYVEKAGAPKFKVYEGLPDENFEESIDPDTGTTFPRLNLKDPKYIPYICTARQNYQIYAKNKYNNEIVRYRGELMRREIVDALTDCVDKQIASSSYIITWGYDKGYTYPDKCHKDGTRWANCIDVMPNGISYQRLADAFLNCGFHILNESEQNIVCLSDEYGVIKEAKSCPKQGGTCYYTVPHLHIILDINP
jgi:hypothetical protein